MTLQLIWENHIHAEDCGYSGFCELYRAWGGGVIADHAAEHVAGERMSVDYAGTTLVVIDPSARGPQGDDGAAVRRRAQRVE